MYSCYETNTTPNSNIFFVTANFNQMSKHPDRSERLRLFFNRMNIKNKDIASKLGIKPAFISQLLNKHSTVTADVAMRIESVYPTLNVKWLINSEGDMLKGREGAPEDTPAAPLVEEPEAGYDLKSREGILEGVLRRVSELEAEMGVLRAALAALEEKVAALRESGGGKE